MKFLTILSLFCSAILASPVLDGVAPLLSSETSQVIPDQYIVVLKEDLSNDEILSHYVWLNNLVLPFSFDQETFHKSHPHKKKGRGLHSTFDIPTSNFRGYVGTFHEQDVEKIRSSPIVEFVEKDQIVYASDVEADAPWGLGRISHRQLPDQQEIHHYAYGHEDGANVTVYIVDTGINIAHVEFEDRSRWGKTIPEGDVDEDGNGHGTHVAGTIGGKTYGVAKKAQVVAVKVLRSNGSGTMSDVVKGVEFVAKDHKARQLAAGKNKIKSAANMSLGGGKSRALDMAVNAVVASGVHFAVAAGNDDRDACNYSPAAAEKAVTVGATTISDTRAWFSNWGKCVDIFAPGHEILSAWIGSNVATNTISGTSMASPHVAGLMAALISRPEYEDLTPAELKKKLASIANKGAIKMGFIPPFSKTKNLLIYNDPPSHEDGEPLEL